MTLLRRAPGVLWRRSFGSVVCLAPGAEPVEIAAPGAALWQELADPVDRDTLVARLAARFDAAPDVVGADVDAVVIELARRGIVTVEP